VILTTNRPPTTPAAAAYSSHTVWGGTANATTQSPPAINTYVLIAIAKKRLQLERHSLYEIPQILRLALFKQVPLHQLHTPPPRDADLDSEQIQLVLV